MPHCNEPGGTGESIVACSRQKLAVAEDGRKKMSKESSMKRLKQSNSPNERASLVENEVTVRIVGLRDRGFTRRLDWIADLFPEGELFPYDGLNIRYLAQAEKNFDVLLLHGDDIPRMSAIVRRWRQLLPSKLFLALCSSRSATNTAALLFAGADLVFGLDTPLALASAQTGALLSRASRAQAEQQ